MKSELDYLLSPAAIRERSLKLFEATIAGKTHFIYHSERLDPLVDYVIEVIRSNYPSLEIPFHSRWGHFKVGGINRVAELDQKLASLPADERARTKLDLVIVSVLLDAGAGMAWNYREKTSGRDLDRSEGLAVASFRMFMEGAFSNDTHHPFQASAQGLQDLTEEKLAQGFQVTSQNPLLGLEGRVELLHALGRAIAAHPDIFPGGRPGGILDYMRGLGRSVPATRLLRAVLDGLGSIWPGRIQFDGANLGDCWRHPLLGAIDQSDSLIPFHKLSQWLTYSLIEPLHEGGVEVSAVHEMTGLPEYRNGGLLIDQGLLSLKDPANAQKEHAPDSPLIIEWRALTIVALDRIAEKVRSRLGLKEADFPLAKVLEGGTWWAGRKAAKEKRADGAPPLKLKSDGTVF